MTSKPSVLITGATAGIGEVYADRFAKRGHDLVLVARNQARMAILADRLRREAPVTVEIVPADLTARIGILVNNAGGSLPATALTRLASAVARRFVERGEGSIINISSALGLVPGIRSDPVWRDQSLRALPQPGSSA